MSIPPPPQPGEQLRYRATGHTPHRGGGKHQHRATGHNRTRSQQRANALKTD